ncbi:hypothetical protein EVJ58_g470 [Rhodofomes roseus]|uniref:Uncharacterized protein n=1 Tax=Rhodofomes roseus TaxID=34475 RepID=A0A4Y9Z6C2_9APHY|nr:hypothetical protein EVJ58_g470 [Rhodofomes roseus]
MTTPTVEVPIRVLNETIGAFMLSAIIGAVLQGVNIGQAIFYFRHQKTDPLIMKCLILFVLAVNVFHFFLVIDALYLYTVDGRSNPSNLNTLTWSVIAILLVSVVGDLGVKGYVAMTLP